ncbi:MAG: CehA/McbA family metallohydrolase, partial [Planctomycetes bacterium]|nr:CehA/McbA family metallohydrolase [Planctomycetota bacterium]
TTAATTTAALSTAIAAAAIQSGGLGSTSGASAPVAIVAPQKPLRWLRGDLHVHTDHSDGTDTVAQILEIARYKSLDFIFLSDHDTLSQVNDPDFVSTPDLTVLPACEWTEVNHGGVLAPKTVPPHYDRSLPAATWPAQTEAIIAKVHAEGGAFVVNHPADRVRLWPWIPASADAMEIWNHYWTVGPVPSDPYSLAKFMREKGALRGGLLPSVDVIRALSKVGPGNHQALVLWELQLERGRKIAAVGGSDRHMALPPGHPTTWVLARENTREGIVEAIRKGRTMISDGPDGAHVTFDADSDGDGSYETIIGDTLKVGLKVKLRIRVQNANKGIVRIVRRRQIILEQKLDNDDTTLTYDITTQAGDWIRVDVHQKIDFRRLRSLNALKLIRQRLPFKYSTLGKVVATLFGDPMPINANTPPIDVVEAQRRFLNLDIKKLGYSRAVITSPIYAR